MGFTETVQKRGSDLYDLYVKHHEQLSAAGNLASGCQTTDCMSLEFGPAFVLRASRDAKSTGLKISLAPTVVCIRRNLDALIGEGSFGQAIKCCSVTADIPHGMHLLKDAAGSRLGATGEGAASQICAAMLGTGRGTMNNTELLAHMCDLKRTASSPEAETAIRELMVLAVTEDHGDERIEAAIDYFMGDSAPEPFRASFGPSSDILQNVKNAVRQRSVDKGHPSHT